MPPSTTRGSLTCQRIASSVCDSGDLKPKTWANVPWRTPPTPRLTGPTSAPTSSPQAAKATAPTTQSGARATSAARGRQRARDRPDEVDDPRAPARSDRVVDADDRVVADGRDRVPARTRRDRLRGLAAAPHVGQDDQRRVRRDDVLGRELRVAARRRVGCVGDVLQAEQRVDLADERLRRG